MNTASLMTISPQAGAAVKSQTPRMVGKTDASSAGTSKETFGDILGKAGDDVKKAMAKSPAEAQGSAVEAKDAKINDDMPGAENEEVLSKDAGKRGEGTPQNSRLQRAEDEDAEEQTLDLGEQKIAPAAVMTFTAEGSAQLVEKGIPDEPDIKASHNLQSILPQSSEDAQRNKAFLAMLSGQQVKTQGMASETGKVLNNPAPPEQDVSSSNKTAKETPLTAELLFKQMGMTPLKEGGGVKASTMLEAQLGTHRLANQLSNIPLQEESAGKGLVTNANALLNDAQLETSMKTVPNQMVNLPDTGRDTTLNAKGMALFQQSEVTMPSRAVGEVMNQARLQQIGADILNADSMVRVSTNDVVLPQDNMFAGIDVVVENQEDKATIRSQLVDKPVNLMDPAGAEFISAAESENNTQQVRNSRQEVSMPPLNNNQVAYNPKEVATQTEPSVKDSQIVNLRQEVSMSPLDNNPATDKGNALGKIVSEQRGAVPWGVSEQGAVIRTTDRNQATGTTLLESQIAALGEKATENTVLASQGAGNQQMGGRQNSDFRQQLPLTQPAVENVIDDDGQVVQQLAEEATGDKAAPPKGQDVHNGPVSVFQQDLADSVRGVERQPEIPQNRDVQDNFQVARQIIEQARLIRRGENTEMVIKLHPDHLGELTLKVSVSANGAVNASFHSDNAQVRTIIENSLVQLKQELNNQGLKVDNVDVYAGLNDGQLPQGEGQQAWQQNPSHNGGANHFNGNLENYDDDTENEAVMQQEVIAADGVDYRV